MMTPLRPFSSGICKIAYKCLTLGDVVIDLLLRVKHWWARHEPSVRMRRIFCMTCHTDQKAKHIERCVFMIDMSNGYDTACLLKTLRTASLS